MDLRFAVFILTRILRIFLIARGYPTTRKQFDSCFLNTPTWRVYPARLVRLERFVFKEITHTAVPHVASNVRYISFQRNLHLIIPLRSYLLTQPAAASPILYSGQHVLCALGEEPIPNPQLKKPQNPSSKKSFVYLQGNFLIPNS